jgi:hypothetical protein
MVLFARIADHEIAFLVRVTEDLGHIPGRGQKSFGVVGWDGFDRHGARFFLYAAVDGFPPGGVFGGVRFRPAVQHQRRQHDQVGIQGLAV